MNIENFYWDKLNNLISWYYEGEFITKMYQDILVANLNKQGKYIYIEIANKNRIELIYHLSYDGKEIYKFDLLNGKLNWEYNNQKIEKICPYAIEAQIFSEFDIVLVLLSFNNNDQKIFGYSLDGNLIFVIRPPEGYIFIRLSMTFITNEIMVPTVVCDGGIANADKYGRTQYHFGIDRENGGLTKLSLAY